MNLGTATVQRHSTAWLRRAGIAAAIMLAGFLLGRITLMGTMSPFGPAYVAACFLARRPESLLAAAGVCLGALLVPDATLYIVTVTVIISAALIALRAAGRRRWAALLITACAFLISAAIFRTQDVQTFMMAVLEMLIGLVMAYVLHTLVSVFSSRKKRQVFGAEETICLAVGAMIVVCSFGPLHIQGVYIANIAAMFLTLCMAYAGGAALGAGVGLALGTACCIGIGAEVVLIGMLGVSGMVAGTIRRLKKPGAALSFMLTGLLFTIAFFRMALWYLVIIEMAAATLMFFLVPGKVFLYAGKYFDSKARSEYEYRMHAKRFKELTVDRLKEVSGVFAQTGEIFSQQALQTIEKDDGISGVLSIVADSTCKNCVFKKSCWEKDFLSTYNVFGKLLSIYETKGSISPHDVDAAFAKKCFNVSGVISTAESVFGAYLLNVQWKKKIEQSRLITGKQLKGVAKVVSDIGQEMDTGFSFLETVEQRIAASLDAAGIRAREICAESSVAGGIAAQLKVKNYNGNTALVSAMENAVSRACGVKMKRMRDNMCSVGKLCTVRFEQARRFGVLTGIAVAIKAQVSGDSHSFQGLKDGRYMLMLCDGMGSGENAHRESAAAVSLTENFYQAGFDDVTIFETINRLLILKGNEEVFTTVDLCVLDLHTGVGKFTKIGAECSYIFRNDGVATVRPGSLPMGILEDVRPVSTQRKVVAGDMIVMMSDGITDKMDSDAAFWFADIPKVNPQETADAILAKALGENKPDDDMTVMVSQIIDE